MIEAWPELAEALNTAKPGTWIRCEAWAVGGGDPDGLEVRIAGGRAVYTNAWCVETARSERVRLTRLDPGDARGPLERARWVKPDLHVDVRRATRSDRSAK